MPKWMINAAGKVFGINSLVTRILASKTYVVGVIAILAGSVSLLQGFMAVSDLATLLTWAQSIPTSEGLQQILAGLAAVGLRHSIEKTAPAAPTAPAKDEAVRG